MLVHVCVPAAWLRLFRQLEQEEGLHSTGRGVAEALPLHSVLRRHCFSHAGCFRVVGLVFPGSLPFPGSSEHRAPRGGLKVFTPGPRRQCLHGRYPWPGLLQAPEQTEDRDSPWIWFGHRR